MEFRLYASYLKKAVSWFGSILTNSCIVSLASGRRLLSEGRLVYCLRAVHPIWVQQGELWLFSAGISNAYGVHRHRSISLKTTLLAQNAVQVWEMQTEGGYQYDSCRKSPAGTVDELDRSSTSFNFPTLATLLRDCGLRKALIEGKSIHNHLVKVGLDKNFLLRNLLLQMYGTCGSLGDLLALFEALDQKNRFSWNFVISAFARHGQSEHALRSFDQMLCEGLIADQFIFVSILSACANESAIAEGKRTHARMIGSGFESTTAVHNALVNMYGKCSTLEDARWMFDEALDRDVVSWTAMISAYAQMGQDKEAFLLYIQMQQEGVIPNKVTFISILNSCASQEAQIEGKRVHASVMACGLESEVELATCLVNMYGKCGSVEDARRLFECLPNRNTVSWTAMIASYSQHGHSLEALQLHKRMLCEGVIPDKITIVSIFDACACQAAFITGRQLHAAIMGNHFESDMVVASAMVNMYGKCGSLDYGRMIFNEMQERNVLSWTAMIAAYAHHGHSEEAFHLFDKMQREGMVLDKVALCSIIEACATQATLVEGKWVHGLIKGSGLESDVVLATGLVNMYGKCGSLGNARMLFDKMPERNLVSWTAMIAAYAQHGHGKAALLLFDQMQQEGVYPNNVTFVSVLSACSSEDALADGKRIHICITNSEFNGDIVVTTALVNMYGKCGRLEDSRRLFNAMVEPNVVSWNTMIAAYAHAGYGKEAIELFDQMVRKGVIPTKATFVSILDACASHAALGEGNCTHAVVVPSGLDLDVDVENVVIHMYGKCGRLQDAQNVFDQMLQRDVVSWNTLIAAYAQHGHAKKALNLFDQMQKEGPSPDKVTFVSVLSACSHAGLLNIGGGFFNALTEDHGIAPTTEHYHCMIDMLGRAGLLNQAEDLLNEMPFLPNLVTWMTLLSACREQLDIGRGERAVKYLIELDSEHALPYVMLSNIYSAACKGDDAEDGVIWKRRHYTEEIARMQLHSGEG